MSNDKLSSNSDYTVSSVTSIDVNTKIVKRPYLNTPFSSSKKHNKSNSFKDTLKSVVSHKISDDSSEDFSNLLSNELNDSLRLRIKENSRIIKTNLQNNKLTDDTINSTGAADKPELQSKAIDTSILCKKIELLNSLRK